MAAKSSYTDIVHFIVRDAEEPLCIKEIVDLLIQSDEENPPKNARSTVRSALRSSGLIKAIGKDQYSWLPRILRGARMRFTFHHKDFAEKRLNWDSDLLIAQWPAAEEAETRRVRGCVTWDLGDSTSVELELDEVEGEYSSDPGEDFWNWLESKQALPGDDLVISCADPENSVYEVEFQARGLRNDKLIKERNRLVKRRADSFLSTQRENLAKPREIVAALVAQRAYHDSIPPQGLINLLPETVVERYGRTVPFDSFQNREPASSSQGRSSEPPAPISPIPDKSDESTVEPVILEEAEELGESSSVALEIPFNTGRELPDDKSYIASLNLLEDRGGISPELAIEVLNLSRMCSPAYALMSQTPEYRKEALDLAGQSVVAAERRIAHGLIESLITGADFSLEDAMADYFESRSFLARALWHGNHFDDAIEQAMHCFEIDPEDPGVREDLFVMLFDTDRHEVVLSLLESFPGASVTEELYHKALAALVDDPESKDAKKALRKAVSHNTYLACLFLGEDPKKAKKSSLEEAAAYEAAYGFLWRREDVIFDLLEEIVLAKR